MLLNVTRRVPVCLRSFNGPTRQLSKRRLAIRPNRILRCSKSDNKTEPSIPKSVEMIQESIKENGSNKNGDGKQRVSSYDYPMEEETDNGSFFPVREPGDFPSVEVTKIREAKEEEEFDPLRDGPLRYLGYANELGEAFAAWLPPGSVPFSYAVAVAYVLADTRDKGLKAFGQAQKELNGEEGIIDESVNVNRLTYLLSVERSIDTIVWQLLASVIIPGYTIHTVVAIVHYMLQSGLHLDSPALMAPAVMASLSTVAAAVHSNSETVAGLVEKSVPTFCGLATIPFIVHPIDTTVHAILNVSMRPALRKFLCDNGQGCAAGLKICDETCMQRDFPVLSDDTTFIDAFKKSFHEAE